jgi:hypothetical protein
VKHVAAWLAMWVGLWWLWMLLVGEWNRDELVAATIAATLAATIGELARTRAGLKPTAPVLAGAWKVPWAVVADFAILMWELPRRRRGVFRDRPAAGSWPAFLANLSPNAYIVDMDDDRVVLHDLVPRRASEEPL